MANSSEESKIIAALDHQYKEKIKRNKRFRNEILEKKVTILGKEVKDYISKDQKVKKKLEEAIDLGVGDFFSAYLVSKEQTMKFYKIFAEIYESEACRIRSKHGTRMFKKNNISIKMGRKQLGINPITYKSEPFNFFPFVSSARSSSIFLNPNKEKPEAYKELNHSKEGIYKNSRYPEKYPYSIYVPYLVNNQLPYARNYVYWNEYVVKGNDTRVTKRRSQRAWHRKSDRGFIKRIVSKFNSDPRVPIWVRLSYNDDLYDK